MGRSYVDWMIQWRRQASDVRSKASYSFKIWIVNSPISLFCVRPSYLDQTRYEGGEASGAQVKVSTQNLDYFWGEGYANLITLFIDTESPHVMPFLQTQTKPAGRQRLRPSTPTDIDDFFPIDIKIPRNYALT